VKLLLDMGLAQSTARTLRGSGHDATHLREQALQRLDDQSIVDKAVAEDRVIVTSDLDFSRIVALSRRVVPSVITLRLADMRPVTVNRVVSDAVARFADELGRGALVTVDERGIRVRSLPIPSG